jgi:hypothetical protein
MLVAMDIPAAAAASAAPWLVLGLVLGAVAVLLVGLAAGLLLRGTGGRPPSAATADDDPTTGAGYREDDLPGFLEAPPGSVHDTAPARGGWAALGTAGVPAAIPPALPWRRTGRRDTVVVLAAMAVTALLLIGVAAGVAATSGARGVASSAAGTSAPARASAPPPPEVAARLTFGGVVLEQRAVGVTATYPVVELSSKGGAASAHVEFPTFNCLTGEAPADPVAAGCVRSVTEYADLSSPDLELAQEREGLLAIGRFPTHVQPNGGPAAPTGRVYELRITAGPGAGPTSDGWRPAEGVLELGTDRAATAGEPGVSVLRVGS